METLCESRISRDEWAMSVAYVTALRSTCLRRHVGCVLLDKHGFVLATGYNGVPAGQPHCNAELVNEETGEITYPHSCPGCRAESGTNLDACNALHAEWNALLQCRDSQAIVSAFVTTSPCITCTKMFLNTSCQRIVFLDEYPQPAAKEKWISAGRKWERFSGFLAKGLN